MKIYVINVERHLDAEAVRRAEEYFTKKLSELGVKEPKVLILPPGASFSAEDV